MSQPRKVLLVSHAGRKSNIETAALAAELLRDAGISVRVVVPKNDGAIAAHPVLSRYELVPHCSDAIVGVDFVLVMGGDGTFLRAADLAYMADLPMLGINLGHIGFLAEWERDSLDEAVKRVVSGEFSIEERMTIAVQGIGRNGESLGSGWALNEVSVENQNRSGVLDAIVEVDGRPVSSFGCDGVIISTPTGSTAYAFSAGGPVLWPELDAILVVPNNAHALFTKPLVVSPRSEVAVESRSASFPAHVVMDGFRKFEMPPGRRVEVVRGERSIKWVRLDERPFTDRLVSKLRLPVEGWRGPGQRRHEC